MSNNGISPQMQKAAELYQSGDSIGAENILLAASKAANEKFGSQSHEFAQSNYELGSLLVAIGRLPDAAKALQVACDISIPNDSEATKDRLTYMMQLGELYGQMGELDQAEKLLLEGLALRESFYGKSHAGYGFGMEPLGVVLMNQNKLPEALKCVEEMIDNFWKNGHPKIASAIPLRALIMAKMNHQRNGFEGLDDVPDELMVDMIEGGFRLVDQEDPAPAQQMLTCLLDVISQRFGPQHASTTRLQTGLAEVSRLIGQSEGRLEMIEKVIESHLANGEKEQAVQTMLGLALAQSELKQMKKCEQTYKAAFNLSKELGNYTLQSQSLRNAGLFYAETERLNKAAKVLKTAVEAGRRSKDDEMHGRSLVALGIFLQHQEQLEEARPLLAEAIELLPPSHPDGVCCRSHLNAIENNESCGCGDMSNAICSAFKAHLLSVIPKGFVNDVEVGLCEKQGFEISVNAAREYTEEERDLLSRTIQQATIDFQKRLEKQQ